MNKQARALSDKQIRATIDTIKLYWPQYEIQVFDIRNPTKNSVLSFFTECIAAVDQKYSAVMREEALDQAVFPAECTQEDIMHWKLLRIPALLQEEFKLGELYTFEPKRLNKLMFVTTHFLVFSNSIIDHMTEECNSIFEAQTRDEQNKARLDEAKQEKLDKLAYLTVAREENAQLAKSVASLAPQFEDVLQLIAECRARGDKSREQAAGLKTDLELLEGEIEALQKKQSQLKAQVVDEKEFRKLQQDLQALISDAQNLEDVDSNNGMLELRENVDYLRMCVQELDKFRLPEEWLQLADLRIRLRTEEEKLEYLAAAQEKEQEEVEELNKRLESELAAVRAQNEFMKNVLKTEAEEAVLKQSKAKAGYRVKQLQQQREIEQLEKSIADSEVEYGMLQADFLQKLDYVGRKQEEMRDKFTSFSS